MSSSESELSDWASEDEPQNMKVPIFKTKEEQTEWERKQRNREYRVAARREKRTRKADEKKQRKLNATILRRMTKNPEKYTKNVDRNRRREVQQERYKIWREAVAQAERLAAIHDPSGKSFNVGAVVLQEDGKVISVETLNRRAKAQAEKQAEKSSNVISDEPTGPSGDQNDVQDQNGDNTMAGVNPARQALIEPQWNSAAPAKRLSKTQQKKLALLEDRPPPPKPVIPEGISIPEGEENWLSLWHLTDAELERRVLREKKRKADERKALRQKQKEGKVERRAARDERRKIYREKKLEWKTIKEEEKRHKRTLERIEQEETKKIEVEVNILERRRIMEVCAKLGFTLENVEGVDEVKPRALGMKGREVDFSILELGDTPSELKIKGEKAKATQQPRSGRVDLGLVTDESKARLMTSGDDGPGGMDGDFVSLGDMVDEAGQEIGASEFNHKLRRKLRRAIEAAQIKKEVLVRKKAVEYCEEKGIEIPTELVTEYQPIKLNARRILEDGTMETEKQERSRKRLELAEYNKAAKVLRKQAKAEAIEAGLRKFAVMTGQPPIEMETEQDKAPFDGTTLPGIQILGGEDAEKSSSKKRSRSSDDSEDRTSKKSKSSGDLVNGDVLVEPTLSNSGEHGTEKKTKKKSKHAKHGEAEVNGVEKSDDPEGRVSKKRKETASSGSVAHQWNPDALSGGEARKNKFVRLLGGNKVNGTDEVKPKKSSTLVDIAHVQEDLEQQFESGTRRKHDGQGKRKGLGA